MPPVIGRNLEVADLLGRVAALVSERRGDVVLIEGGAGVGKSALLREFHSRMTSVSGNVIDVYTSRGEPFSKWEPLCPWKVRNEPQALNP